MMTVWSSLGPVREEGRGRSGMMTSLGHDQVGGGACYCLQNDDESMLITGLSD